MLLIFPLCQEITTFGYFLDANCSSLPILLFSYHAAYLGWPVEAAQLKQSYGGTGMVHVFFYLI
jgi:hypothetical protein